MSIIEPIALMDKKILQMKEIFLYLLMQNLAITWKLPEEVFSIWHFFTPRRATAHAHYKLGFDDA